jgi:hypothetical protein
VTEKYEFLVGLGPPSCAVGSGQALGSLSRFVVAGKGEIYFAPGGAPRSGSAEEEVAAL